MPPLRNLFEAKSSRVVRVLLIQPGRTWVLRELAQESQVSLGMAYYVTSALIQVKLVSRDESNRLMLADPYRLIRQWAASCNYLFLNRFSEYYTFDTEFEVFLSRLKNLPGPVTNKYALTLHAAAWLTVPYVRPTDFHIYIRPRTTEKKLLVMAKALNISPIERSGNVKFVTPHDEGVFVGSRSVDGAKVVSLVQLYVDLFNYPGRGEEAATKVFEKLANEWRVKDSVRH